MAADEFLRKDWPSLYDGLTADQKELVKLGVVLKAWGLRGINQTFEVGR